MKVLIAIPCYNTILVPTMTSIIGVLRNEAYEADFKAEESIYVHNNRNRLVESARNYTHIFFVDHDVVFGEDTLERLLAHDKDVISGKYNYRHLPEMPILFDERDGEHYNIIKDLVPDELFKCWGVPTGCLLIKMPVFDKLQKPYFNYAFREDGEVKFSEDMFFCDKLDKAGIDRWVDPTIEVGHWGCYLY